jgi:hypothetical protein
MKNKVEEYGARWLKHLEIMQFKNTETDSEEEQIVAVQKKGWVVEAGIERNFVP